MNKEEIDKALAIEDMQKEEYKYVRYKGEIIPMKVGVNLLDGDLIKFCELEQENKQLKEKINKAKIYMRDNMSLREYENHYMNLMLILKGDSNEK